MGLVPKNTARLVEGQVYSDTHCLLYEKFDDCFSKYKLKSEHVKVRIAKCAEAIKQCCERICDEWSFKVKILLAYYKADLVAADCDNNNHVVKIFVVE